MDRIHHATSLASAESGAVLVIFAVFMAMAVAAGSFVLDVGSWFERQRHLQLQADAAAFAGASQIEFPCTTSVAENIYKTAAQYGGANQVLTPGGTFSTEGTLQNTQVDEEAGRQQYIHAEVNKKAFYGQSKTD